MAYTLGPLVFLCGYVFMWVERFWRFPVQFLILYYTKQLTIQLYSYLSYVFSGGIGPDKLNNVRVPLMSNEVDMKLWKHKCAAKWEHKEQRDRPLYSIKWNKHDNL